MSIFLKTKTSILLTRHLTDWYTDVGICKRSIQRTGTCGGKWMMSSIVGTIQYEYRSLYTTCTYTVWLLPGNNEVLFKIAKIKNIIIINFLIYLSYINVQSRKQHNLRRDFRAVINSKIPYSTIQTYAARTKPKWTTESNWINLVFLPTCRISFLPFFLDFFFFSSLLILLLPISASLPVLFLSAGFVFLPLFLSSLLHLPIPTPPFLTTSALL